MIKVDTLTISEFRGIRELTLILNRRNFVVCGSNGTGKSGIVDALEFVLTGTISRLTGKGRGDLSVKEHGPHVDSQKSPEKASVEAVVWIPSLNKSVKARRTVKSPSALELTPDSLEARAIFLRLGAHPEIALSRREIIRFVLTEPGQRAKDIQALLKLDELEVLRQRLQKIVNAADTALKRANRDRDTARMELIRAMDIADATGPQMLEAANRRRAIIGVAPLSTLGIAGSLRDGLSISDEIQTSRVNKVLAKAEVEAASASLLSWQNGTLPALIADARKTTEVLQADEVMLNAVVRDDFLGTALELYDGELCPVCDTPKSLEELSAAIQYKRVKLGAVKELRSKAEAAIAPVCMALDADCALARSTYPHAKILLEASDLEVIVEHGVALKKASEALNSLLPISTTLNALGELAAPTAFSDVLVKLRSAIETLPEPSQQDSAREYLITAQLRLETLRNLNSDARTSESRAVRARRVFTLFGETLNTALQKVYDDVQGKFAELYRRINEDDEDAFDAKLTPSLGKLGFGVDLRSWIFSAWRIS